MVENVRIVDLSLEIKEGEGVMGARIQHIGHREGVPGMLQAFPGITAGDLPDGLGWSVDIYTMNVHTGTHIDAPWHYHPTSEGKPSKTIDEMPLELAYGDGVVLDMRHKKPGDVIGVTDLQEALEKIGYNLKPRDIVLIRTDTDKHWDTPQYGEYPGAGREATIWLVDQGVKVVGTDAPGWDRTFKYAAAEFRETGNRKVIWEGHFAGIEREYFQMEKLANLDQLPPYGFKVCCFPIKLLKASAAWIRPVAIVPEG
jgi:kynurenine formamidase